MTPAPPHPEKQYIITGDGLAELEKYFLEHKDDLFRTAWKNFRDKHIRHYSTTPSEREQMLVLLMNIIKCPDRHPSKINDLVGCTNKNHGLCYKKLELGICPRRFLAEFYITSTTEQELKSFEKVIGFAADYYFEVSEADLTIVERFYHRLKAELRTTEAHR